MEICDDNDSVILVSGEEHRLEGNKHYRAGDYKAAYECYTAAIDTEPETPGYYNNRSAVNIMLCKYKEALLDAIKCTDMENTNTKFINRLGKCQLLIGQLDESEVNFNKVLLLDQTNKEANDQRSRLIICRENYEKYSQQNTKQDFRHALFCLERCIEICPGSEQMHLERIRLFVSLKRYVEAKSQLEKLINSSDCSQVKNEALFYRGLIFYYMDHADKATEHLQHVLRQNPDHVPAQKAYKRCKKLQQLKQEGNRLVQTRNYEEALAIYTTALQMDNEHDLFNARLYCNRALTLLKLGKYLEAIADCEKAIKLDVNYDKPKCRLVSCLMEMEKWQEAVDKSDRLVKDGIGGEEAQRLLKEAQRGLKRAGQLNPYSILGVSRGASDTEIKKAYKKQSLAHHPDRHPNETDENKKKHEKKFKELGTAYSILSDAKKKRMYDSGMDVDEVLGNSCGGGSSYGGDERAHEMFQAFFGSNTRSGASHFTYNFG